MTKPSQRSRSRLVAAVLVAASLGCSRSQQNQDFIPPEDKARAALDAALRAWSRGDTPGSARHNRLCWLSTSGGGRDGRHGYNILGPVPAEAPLCFAVQLKLGNPPEEVRERYVVVGIDPLWVWRYDDYLMITHWSHPMPADKKSESPKR